MLNNIGPMGFIILALIIWVLWKIFNRGANKPDDK